MNVAIILLGGSGTRFGNGLPKQLFLVKEKPLCYYTIKSFNDSRCIDQIVLVIDNKLEDIYKEIVKTYGFNKVTLFVQGGNTRQESSYNGLKALEGILTNDDIVLIHDGARPLVDACIISDNINYLDMYPGVITAIPSEDTLAIVKDDKVSGYTDRTKTFRVQTPQSFKYGVILCAHKKYAGQNFTDDAQLLMQDNIEIGIIRGNKKLLKVTTTEDIKYIEEYLDE